MTGRISVNEDALNSRQFFESADSRVASLLDLSATRVFALESLLTVSSIEWSTDIKTACVECAERPRLLLNPDFVAEYCGTRERLAALILHELSHISLGHTRLYPRGGWAHNVAFDAIINRDLSFHFARTCDPEPYTALFTSSYGPAEDPFFILRPPEGWPDKPQWNLSRDCNPELGVIHRRLYNPVLLHSRAGSTAQVTYGEIIAALHQGMDSYLLCATVEDVIDSVKGRLLGGHGSTPAERAAESGGRDAATARALSELLSGIGGLLNDASEAGDGGNSSFQTLEQVAKDRRLELALQSMLRNCFVRRRPRARAMRLETAGMMSVNRSRDRRAAAREVIARKFDLPRPLLFVDETVRLIPKPRCAPIYLDVSGSMSGLVESLHAALVPLRRQLKPDIYAFSTTVDRIAPEEFEKRRVSTTFGTSIQPVVDHVVGLGRGKGPHDVLVLTDGYFDMPRKNTAAVLRAAGARLHLGVIGNGPLHEREPWVTSSKRLPYNG